MRVKLETLACALAALVATGWVVVHGFLHSILHLVGLSCPF